MSTTQSFKVNFNKFNVHAVCNVAGSYSKKHNNNNNNNNNNINNNNNKALIIKSLIGKRGRFFKNIV
jgi:hypothetical protein